jgi:hypothetical protein
LLHLLLLLFTPSSYRQATEDFAARFLIEKEELAANSARFLIEKEELAANSAQAAAAEAERERTKHSEMLRVAAEVKTDVFSLFPLFQSFFETIRDFSLRRFMAQYDA